MEYDDNSGNDESGFAAVAHLLERVFRQSDGDFLSLLTAA